MHFMNGFRSDNDELIHAVYLSVFNLPVSTQKKCPVMATLFGTFETNWRVIGITLEALKFLSDKNDAGEMNDYRYRKGICRAHIVDRNETAKQLFDRKTPADIEDFFTTVWTNDRTVLATKAENKLKGKLPEIFPIPLSENLFPSRQVGFRHGRAERNFLRKLHESFTRGDALLEPITND